MKSLQVILTLVVLLSSLSCSVISRQVREESLPAIPFKTLLENSEEYVGETVILGGYILEIENKADETNLLVIQTPLSIGGSPSKKHRSAGRFAVSHKGFLDPELYYKDKRITVAGIVVGLQQGENGKCIFPCLKLESREIYLWPDYDQNNHYLHEYPYYYPHKGYLNYWQPFYWKPYHYFP